MNNRKITRLASIGTAVTTVVTFILALKAVPISGTFCPDGIKYPYLSTLEQFPNDYIWMVSAIVMLLMFNLQVNALTTEIDTDKRGLAKTAVQLSTMSSLILIVNYFLQFSVIPISLTNGETDGIALLTQYNPHGIFIALEELGYLLMAFSFFFLSFLFKGTTKLGSTIRIMYSLGFYFAILALIITFKFYGIHREDIFEVVVILITWLTLIVTGLLTAIYIGKYHDNDSSKVFM